MEDGKKAKWGEQETKKMNKNQEEKNYKTTESICFIFRSLSSEKLSYLPCVSIQNADRTKHIL